MTLAQTLSNDTVLLVSTTFLRQKRKAVKQFTKKTTTISRGGSDRKHLRKKQAEVRFSLAFSAHFFCMNRAKFFVIHISIFQLKHFLLNTKTLRFGNFYLIL